VTPEQISLRARCAVATRLSREDRHQMTAAANAGRLARFERQVTVEAAERGEQLSPTEISYL
jgi:hypothetical protein